MDVQQAQAMDPTLSATGAGGALDPLAGVVLGEAALQRVMQGGFNASGPQHEAFSGSPDMMEELAAMEQSPAVQLLQEIEQLEMVAQQQLQQGDQQGAARTEAQIQQDEQKLQALLGGGASPAGGSDPGYAGGGGGIPSGGGDAGGGGGAAPAGDGGASSAGGSDSSGASGQAQGAAADSQQRAGGGSAVQAMTDMANSLVGKPYVVGGGHGGWGASSGYDCSGFVSAVLHAGGYLSQPVDTTALPGQPGMDRGPGQHVTIYDRALPGQSGHVIMEINGQFYESGGRAGPWGGGGGVEKIGRPSNDYLASFPTVLHPKGL